MQTLSGIIVGASNRRADGSCFFSAMEADYTAAMFGVLTWCDHSGGRDLTARSLDIQAFFPSPSVFLSRLSRSPSTTQAECPRGMIVAIANFCPHPFLSVLFTTLYFRTTILPPLLFTSSFSSSSTSLPHPFSYLPSFPAMKGPPAGNSLKREPDHAPPARLTRSRIRSGCSSSRAANAKP